MSTNAQQLRAFITLRGLASVVFRLLAFLVAAGAAGFVGLVPTLDINAALIGAGLSATYGFPTWLASIYVASRKRAVGVVFFTLAGLIAGLIGSVLFAVHISLQGGMQWHDISNLFGTVLPYALPGGLIGGITYWALAVWPWRGQR